jgi:hypothetical protein
MSPSKIDFIERTIGVTLPLQYRSALQDHRLSGNWIDHPEFITNADVLISENKHFQIMPEDLSDVRSLGLIGRIKFWLLYGSGKRLIEHRKRLYKTWVIGKRFIIGTNLGEEQYYIILDGPAGNVYIHELETQHSRVVAKSLFEWLTEVYRRQAETESND